MNDANLATLFDANYFAHGCGAPYERNPIWFALHNAYAAHIADEIHPKSVLDAGCAIGLLVEALRNRGIDAWGLDISDYAISQVHPAMRPFCNIGSVAEPLDKRYDLIVCIEVLEHLPQKESERALANLCQHSDDILFSSSPEDVTEPTHFNVQPPGYWADLFLQRGFVRDHAFDAGFITPWAARFRKSSSAVGQIVRDYEDHLYNLHKKVNAIETQAATKNRSDAGELDFQKEAQK